MYKKIITHLFDIKLPHCKIKGFNQLDNNIKIVRVITVLFCCSLLETLYYSQPNFLICKAWGIDSTLKLWVID